MEEISSRCCKFSNVEECSLSLEVSSFKFKGVEEISSKFCKFFKCEKTCFSTL